MSELHHMSVLDVIAAFRSRELSPVEYLTHLTSRIAAHDGEINAVMDVMDEPARQAAQAAAEVYARADADTPLPALLGVPLLVKEQHNVAGCSATRGSRVLAGQTAPADHPVVARLREAGAIPFARTTTPEFSCATFTQTAAWGTTRNPFNPDCTPGGSSGGSGAAVAAGYGPLATASDIAGSTRIPAAFGGLPGFKTPYGRTPGVVPLNTDWYRGDHVLARTVADTAYATNIIVGPHAGDHATIAPAHVLPTAFAGAAGVAGMRIAVSRDLGCYDVDPEVAAGLDTVVAALRGAGAELVEIDLALSLADVTDASSAHYGHLIAQNMTRMCGGDLDLLEPYSKRFVEYTRDFAERISLLEAADLETTVQAQIADAMAGFDALLTPTSAIGALEADNAYLEALERPAGPLDFYWQAHMTIPFNIANRCPVMAVPSGIGPTGVPTSVQIVGHPFADDSVFTVAAAVEELLPFPRSPLM